MIRSLSWRWTYGIAAEESNLSQGLAASTVCRPMARSPALPNADTAVAGLGAGTPTASYGMVATCPMERALPRREPRSIERTLALTFNTLQRVDQATPQPISQGQDAHALLSPANVHRFVSGILGRALRAHVRPWGKWSPAIHVLAWTFERRS